MDTGRVNGTQTYLHKQDTVLESEGERMSRIRISGLAATGLAIALTSAAATQVRADVKTFRAIEGSIKKSARIPFVARAVPGSQQKATALSTYVGLKSALHSTPIKTVQAVSALTGRQTTSKITQVGNPPPGFGSVFEWDRSQPSALILVFVNPADPLGVAIAGLQPGDLVQIRQATGLASFSKDTGNPLIASILTLVADGAADAVAVLSPGAIFGAPAGPSGGSGSTTGTTTGTTPGTGSGAGSASVASTGIAAIEQTGKDAAALFTGTGNPEDFRDPFGVDPGSHVYKRQEGGLVVCMPQNNGVTYSGDQNHSSYWPTLPTVYGQPRGLPPAYRQSASLDPFFFIGQSPSNGQNANNSAVCQAGGAAYLLAWDWNFADNSGYYEVWVQLTQAGAATAPLAPATPAVVRKAKTPH
jgi:hypothetical protein